MRNLVSLDPEFGNANDDIAGGLPRKVASIDTYIVRFTLTPAEIPPVSKTQTRHDAT